MASCPDFDPLLSQRAAGDLSPADAVRLDAHLSTCAGCRAELTAYEQALGLARLPAVTDAERQPLSHLATRARAELDDHSPLMKALWRLLGLTAVAAGLVVVIANKAILPGAERGAAQRAAAVAKWTEPDPAALLQRVERQHPELAVRSENELSRAEQLADAAYLKAIAETE